MVGELGEWVARASLRADSRARVTAGCRLPAISQDDPVVVPLLLTRLCCAARECSCHRLITKQATSFPAAIAATTRCSARHLLHPCPRADAGNVALPAARPRSDDCCTETRGRLQTSSRSGVSGKKAKNHARRTTVPKLHQFPRSHSIPLFANASDRSSIPSLIPGSAVLK